jgi:hypothetical protein
MNSEGMHQRGPEKFGDGYVVLGLFTGDCRTNAVIILKTLLLQ